MWQSDNRTSGVLGLIKRCFKCPLSLQVDEMITFRKHYEKFIVYTVSEAV